jgi:uncharacterized protein (TIGR03437 family)
MSFKNVALIALFARLVAAQTAANWTQQLPTASPSVREFHAMAYDSAHGQTVLFGGTGDSGALNDTWVWDGSNWTQRFPQTSPPARYSHAMVYDSAHGQTVLFGGFGNTFLNDTWAWDGTNWTQKSPQTSPPARYTHAMAYDSAHGQTVLFGGFDNNLLGDTWVWDSTNWTQKTPQSSPSPRQFHAMAYDSARQQTVLFGGEEINTNTMLFSRADDTWVWDGTTWTQKKPQLSPPEYAQVIAYDSLRSQVVMFGDTSGSVEQTWVWDGVSWIQKSPQTLPSPPDRPDDWYFAIAYDSAHDQVVLFGYSAPSVLDVTWTWYGGTPPPPLPSITTVVSASGFGGFSAVAPGSWVEIYGSNLAPDTRQWAGSDFSGNNAPTSLDGVVVNIGGQKAFIDYISSSPGQVNAQLPSNIATGGQLGVTLTNANGTSSAFNITVNPTEPGLLAPSSFAIGGKQYAVALLPDNATYVLPTGAIAGVASRPAHPGETITLYGIGFGAVSPNIPAGQIVTASNQLSASFQILFGQTAAQVAYAGLAPGFVGLYQFDVVVPAVPDSDLVPLTFNLGGAASTQTLYTSVHQ